MGTMFRGSARDEKLAQAHVFTALRRVEIAAAEDAVDAAKASIEGGSRHIEVTVVLLENLVTKYETLLDLLRRPE